MSLKILLLIFLQQAFAQFPPRGARLPPPGGSTRPGFRGANKGPISYNLIDGSGICKTWSQYARQQASIWDRFQRGNEQDLQTRILNLISAWKCRPEPPPPDRFRGKRQSQFPFNFGTGQKLQTPDGSGPGCQPTGRKCDSGTTRTESAYFAAEVTHNGQRKRLVVTNGIPDHCYQVDAAWANPNEACEHYSAMLVPLNPPRPTGPYREHRMGPVGVAISGAFFYNHRSAEPSCNVAALQEQPTFDPCDGHADPGCRYHYHKAPVCIPGWNTCSFMGYIQDGFPVYGNCSVRLENGQEFVLKSKYEKIAGKNGCDVSEYVFQENRAGGTLDRANGYYFDQNAVSTNGGPYFPAGTYAYFFTPEFPFIMPGTFAEPEQFCYFIPSDL